MKTGNILIFCGVLILMIQLENRKPQWPIYQRTVALIEIKP